MITKSGIEVDILSPKRDEVTEEWRRLHNEELYKLHDSPDIIRIMKSRRLRHSGHVARMRGNEDYILFWLVTRRERDSWEDRDVFGIIILEEILERLMFKTKTGLPRIESNGERLILR